jgi:tetratricopeptide (TPR) repeat protein
MWFGTASQHHKKMYKLIFILLIIFFLASCGGESVREKESNQELPADRFTELKMRAEKEPENAAVFNELALYYLSLDHFNEALHNINKSLQIEPNNTAHFVTLSDIYLMMGDAERAKLTLYRAMDMEPANADIYVHVGRIHVFLEDYPRAFENLRQAIELDKNNSNAYFWRGVVRLETGDTARAISDWQVAVAHNPDSFDGYFQLGLLMAERKDRFAFDYLDHALRSAPPEPDLLYDIGMAFQGLGRFSKAIETYEHILTMDTCFYRAWYNIGYIHLVELEEYIPAIEYFTRALNCKNDYAEALYNRGLAYEVLENYASARSDYQAVLRIRVNFPKAIEGLNRLDSMQ